MGIVRGATLHRKEGSLGEIDNRVFGITIAVRYTDVLYNRHHIVGKTFYQKSTVLYPVVGISRHVEDSIGLVVRA